MLIRTIFMSPHQQKYIKNLHYLDRVKMYMYLVHQVFKDNLWGYIRIYNVPGNTGFSLAIYDV